MHHQPQSPPSITTIIHHQPHSPQNLPQSPSLCSTNHIHRTISPNDYHHEPPTTFTTKPPTITITMQHQPQSHSPPLCTTNHIHDITSHNHHHYAAPTTITTTIHYHLHSPQNLPQSPSLTTITSHNHHHYAPPTTFTTSPLTITTTMHYQPHSPPTITTTMHQQPHSPHYLSQSPPLCSTKHNHHVRTYNHYNYAVSFTNNHNTISTLPDITPLHTYINGISIPSYRDTIT